MKMMHSEHSSERKGLRVWFFASVALGVLAWGCGSKIDSGNTGSETHWLKSCDKDSECGEYSCYCGICTRACDEQSECDEVSGVLSQCADAVSGNACGDDAPARMCVKGDGTDVTTDAGDTTDAATGPVSTVLCDGSDDVRFIHRSAGGFVPDEYAFNGRYGHAFLAIDGKCNFWGQSEPGIVVTGTVSAAQIEDYQVNHYGRMDRYDDVIPNWGCPDSSGVLVWDPSGSFQGSRCGIPAGNEELEATLETAWTTAADILRQGVRSQGPLRLLILERTEPESAGNEGLTEWPLDLDPTALIPATRPNDEELRHRWAGIGFAPGARAEALREVMNSSAVTDFQYLGNQDIAFRAVIRDEVPPKVAAALEAAAKEAASKHEPMLGVACDDSSICAAGLACQERASSAGGGTACNTCVKPEDPDWLCHSNDDCCGGTVCCVDCGDKSGTCIVEPDPCVTCLENGGSWVLPNVCDLAECVPDSSCFSQTCPGDWVAGECAGAGRFEECWAAGCHWITESEAQYCSEAIISVPDPEPCAVTAADPSLPGVSVHLETERCRFLTGQGGQFHYRVEFNQSIDFTTPASSGCGLCGDPSNPETWIQFMIDGNDMSYCPECDVGCCLGPIEDVATSFDTQVIEGVVDWPGLQWRGPSDTGALPEGEFPPGSYNATLTVALPGVGEVVATLEISVRGVIID